MYVILLAAMSADGFIARHTNEEALWTSKEDKRFFVKKTKEYGTLIMGRTTWETINRPLPDRRIIVLSSRPSATPPPESVEFRAGEPHAIINNLAQEGVDKVVIVGGAKVYSDYLKAGLVDELWLSTESIIFGSGIPLVTDLAQDIHLERFHQEILGPQTTLTGFRVIQQTTN